MKFLLEYNASGQLNSIHLNCINIAEVANDNVTSFFTETVDDIEQLPLRVKKLAVKYHYIEEAISNEKNYWQET